MSRCPFATWRGPVPNENPGGMIAHQGLVLHVEQGTESGTDAWFHNPQAQVSAHFGVAYDGSIDQWVDTDDRAWAEAAGNPYWVSVETEGSTGQPFTPAQITALARLYAWLAGIYGWPFGLADSPSDTGLGWHGMGGQAWGGHLDCPGTARVNARQQILELAQEEADMPLSTDDKTWISNNTAQHIADIWNGQIAPELTKIQQEVEAIKAKVGA